MTKRVFCWTCEHRHGFDCVHPAQERYTDPRTGKSYSKQTCSSFNREMNCPVYLKASWHKRLRRFLFGG